VFGAGNEPIFEVLSWSAKTGCARSWRALSNDFQLVRNKGGRPKLGTSLSTAGSNIMK
jgi:hypothetical protein